MFAGCCPAHLCPRLPPPCPPPNRQVCGSVLVAPRLQYWEWWTRALVPGEHYVEVSGEEAGICDEARGCSPVLLCRACLLVCC